MQKLWIILAVVAVHAGYATSAGRKEPTISECAAKGGECDESKGRPVCGTDNQTYPTRCHLIRAQCSGHAVSLKHRGSCKECIESRTYVLLHRSTSPNQFIPRCREDGSYAAVQCMDNAGCWCSDPQGKPIQNTTMRFGKPNCPKKAKSNTRRSSPHNANRPRRGCTSADQALFNTNLIRVFHSEHGRMQQLGQLPAGAGKSHHASASASAMSDKAIVDWKFALLDTNRNHQLDRQEFRELKRLVRKAVKPKRCARTFGKFCDTDNDERLSRPEWINCLSKDSVNQQKPVPASDVEPAQEIEKSETGCLGDRATALNEQHTRDDYVYVPECTPDGRYQRVQCYTSAGYCWCVNEDTGNNIAGTSVKNRRPNCAVNTTRPMKGCPEPKKLEFLRELRVFLRNYTEKNATTAVNLTKFGSENEKVATVMFVLLDKNKNAAWERKEWKTFRDLVIPFKNLRKCGKKMPRYCDVNNDKKITMSEWLNCLQAYPTNSGSGRGYSNDFTDTSRLPIIAEAHSASNASGKLNSTTDFAEPLSESSKTQGFDGPPTKFLKEYLRQ